MIKKKNFKTITKIIIGLVVVGLIAYDILPFVSDADGDTISEVLYSGAKEYPIISFMFGVLMGHLFAPLSSKSNTYLDKK